MDVNTFSNELEKIYDEANVKVVALVNKAQEEDGLTWDTTFHVNFANYGNWERAADNFAELCGWIHDRLNGRNRTAKNSVTRKLRKALGYYS